MMMFTSTILTVGPPSSFYGTNNAQLLVIQIFSFTKPQCLHSSAFLVFHNRKETLVEWCGADVRTPPSVDV